MISINACKNGTIILLDGAPYEFTEIQHVHMGRGGSSVQTKIRNLLTGQVLSRNYKESDSFKEADIEKRKVMFLYGHRGEYVFSSVTNKGERYTLTEEQVAGIKRFLKANTEVEALFLDGHIITLKLPIKMDLVVKDAPPGIKGDTAQGGTKAVVLETGATIQVPLFIHEGDVVRVNTETGEYTERMTKAK